MHRHVRILPPLFQKRVPEDKELNPFRPYIRWSCISENYNWKKSVRNSIPCLFNSTFMIIIIIIILVLFLCLASLLLHELWSSSFQSPLSSCNLSFLISMQLSHLRFTSPITISDQPPHSSSSCRYFPLNLMWNSFSAPFSCLFLSHGKPTAMSCVLTLVRKFNLRRPQRWLWSVSWCVAGQVCRHIREAALICVLNLQPSKLEFRDETPA
jgi:hypothetical protein